MTTLRGVDLASYQGLPDFVQMRAAGFNFALIKATQGTSYVNPFLHAALRAARDAGMLVAFYHFAEPGTNTPEAEAAHFLDVVGPLLQPGDVTSLDLETGDGNLAAWALAWLQAVETAVGAKPLLYSGLWFMQPHDLTGNPELAVYGLWLAAYQAQEPDAPAPWPFIAVWQDSGGTTVPGVVGPCDTDVFYGDESQWRAYGVPEPQLIPFDDAERLKLVGFVAGGSGVGDIQKWVGQHKDVAA